MSTKDSICLDANIVLDLAVGRTRKKQVLAFITDKKYSATSDSVATVYYYARKEGVTNKQFSAFIEDFDILSVDESTIDDAFELAGENNDLEDAIQIAACKQAGVGIFVTADKELADLYGDELNIELVG